MSYADVPAVIAMIESQGSLLKMTLKGRKTRPEGQGGRRGIIRIFSPASRRRLMRFMARLKVRKIRATFITLTFTEVVTNEEAKKCFKRFYMRLTRKFPLSSGVWRMEYQPKRGAIHFHLLMFCLPYWKQADLQTTWEGCTKEEKSITDIRLVHGARSVMAYVSKYIAKTDDRTSTSLDDVSYQHNERGKLSGRFWGYINKELLPVGELVIGVLTDRQSIKSLSRWVWKKLGSENPYNSISFHFFADNAHWLCEEAVRRGGCWLDEWEFTTKDHSTPHNSYSPYTEHFSEAELSLISVPTLGHQYRPNEVSLSQPVAGGWVARSSKAVPASRVFPYFDECGIVVSS